MSKQQKESLLPGRREVLIGAGAIGIGALATVATSGSMVASASESGMHMKHGRNNKALTDALMHCVTEGEACIVHCLDVAKTGDTSLVDCQRSIQETVAFCRAHAYLATANSAYLDDMCKLGMKISGDCTKECKKHEKKHALCKSTGEACAACIKECKKHLKV